MINLVPFTGLVAGNRNTVYASNSMVITGQNGNVLVNSNVYINSSGNVGIGTTNPLDKLNVYGNLRFSNSTVGVSGILFADGTYQTTAAGTVQNSSGAAGTVQYSGGSGTFAGDANNFFYDSGNSRLGIGTGAPTNTLSAWGITPAWFRTGTSNLFEVIVGNAATTAVTLGYASSTLSPYGYIKNVGGTNGIAVVNNGSVGIKGITNPQSALDVGGAVAIGTSYAGVTAGPTNGLIVQGTVGIGTSTPQASSILSVAAPSVPKINLQVGAVERAYLQYDESASLVTLDSDAALRFNTNNTERMRIDSFGNVGIGSAMSVIDSVFVRDLTVNAAIQTAGTATVNALVSNVYGRFGQNVTVNSTNVSTSTTTGALIVAGGIGAAGNINLGGYIQMPQMRMYSFTRTIPTVVNNVVELGSATLADGGGMFEISIVCPSSGFSVSKYYILPINFGETAGVWTIAQPISDGGAYSSNDFDLDINVNSNVASFRIRRTAGSTAGTAYVNIKQSGLTLTFAETTATASVTAPTGFYNAAVLRQVDGRVGIGTASPLSTLDVNGISTLRSTTLVNTTTTGANGALQVSGSIGLQGNSQIRQATSSDGSTLQLLATSVVVSNNNSGSYGYSGGGLIASITATDGVILLDVGRSTSTDARVKVVNTSSGNAYLSVEKNGVYTLYASTAGQVGIATSTPGSVLDVNGNASFRSSVSVASATAVASLNVNAGTYTNTLNVNTTANVNALTSNTGITVSAGGITVTGVSQFTGNVNLVGNLNVSGALNVVNSNVLTVSDPLIYLGEGNPGNTFDIGLVGNYNQGTYYHTGFVRDHRNNYWTLFDTLSSEPNVSTGNINWGDSSITFADMRVGNINIMGNAQSTSSTTGVVVINGVGGVGVGGNVNVGGTISTATTATATAASHYWVQTGSDNIIRPKTLVNVQNEIVTFTAVSAAMNSYSVKTANYTAVNNDRLLCDTSGGTFTITLPATPTLGTNITIYDRANFTAIPLTVARNGSTIEGLADDFSLDIGQTRNEIVYDGVTWHIYVSIGPRGLPGSNAAPSSSVAYSIALG